MTLPAAAGSRPAAADRSGFRRALSRSLLLRTVGTALSIGLIAVAAAQLFVMASVGDALYSERTVQLLHEHDRAMRLAQGFALRADAAGMDPDEFVASLLEDQLASGYGGTVGAMVVLFAVPAPADEQPAGAGISVDLAREAMAASAAFMEPAADGVVTEDMVASVAVTGEPQSWKVTIPAVLSNSSHHEPGIVFGGSLELDQRGSLGVFILYSLEAEHDALTMIQAIMTLGSVAIVITIGVITGVMTRQTVLPVRQAARAARRLSDGHFDERMPVRHQDEFAVLATSFNQMAASLQSHIASLEKLSTMQRRFVSDVSHELRTPVTTMGMASAVIYGARDQLDPAAKRSAELLHSQVERFGDLLADLLEVSRFDAGAVALDLGEHDMRRMVAWVVDGAQLLADTKGVEMVQQVPPQPVVAQVDARRVDRIIRNLLVNAIEHAEGRPVTITVADGVDSVAVAVRDEGVGLSPEQAVKVFDRFWRADPSRVRTTGGTGLGLFIAREDAHLHGGTLEVAGCLGQGALFILTLPKRAGQAMGTPPIPLVF